MVENESVTDYQIVNCIQASNKERKYEKQTMKHLRNNKHEMQTFLSAIHITVDYNSLYFVHN